MRIDKAKLAYELARREWRVKRLAELSGISISTLSSIRGGKAIAPETAMKIAIALNIPVEQLVEQEVPYVHRHHYDPGTGHHAPST